MLGVWKMALGPMLLVQGRRTRLKALRLPEAAGPRTGLEGDPEAGDALRLLVVGDSSAAGVGVEHQHQALAQPAAQRLAARTGRPVRWQLVARSGIHTGEALTLAAASNLEPADVVVIALGVNDVTSQRLGRRFIADYRALSDHLVARTGARVVIVNGVPPMHVLPQVPQPLRWYLGQCAFRNDAALAAWVRTRPTHEYLPLQWAARPEQFAPDGYHPGPGQYAQWAVVVAERAALRLGAQVPASAPARRG